MGRLFRAGLSSTGAPGRRRRLLVASARQQASMSAPQAPQKASRRAKPVASSLQVSKSYVVVGDGPVGASVAKHLVRGGAQEVKVLDGRPAGVHSSHADRARIIRKVDAEGDSEWSARNQASLAAFSRMEEESGVQFFTQCGALVVGARDFVQHCRESAEAGAAGLAYEPAAGGLLARWPYLKPATGCCSAVFDAAGGYIDPLRMIAAQNTLAAAEGNLSIVPGEAVHVDGTTVTLANGERLSADKVVLCCGAYTRALLKSSGIDTLPMSASRASRRTVVLLEVSPDLVATTLRDMPTIKYAFAPVYQAETWREQSHVESGSVYILPPVQYPERGGKWFIKIGGGRNEWMAMNKAEEVDSWLTSHGDATTARWLEKLVRGLMPGIVFQSVESMACVTTVDVAGNGVAVHELGGVAAVVACQGKGAGPADAVGAEVAKQLAQLDLPKTRPPARHLDLLQDKDVEESFVRGSGPGGQKINKTACAVILKHLPSGIQVRCQKSRSQSENRKIARRMLNEKLEVLIYGEQSRPMMKKAKAQKAKARRRRKAKAKYSTQPPAGT